jgi:predicted SprT family Zn-dependent metalloprotease
MITKPTPVFYADLQSAYDFFNARLFDSTLPNCLLTVQREKNTMGFFSANRWIGPDSPEHIHEIAINPSYLANFKAIELLQTIVHEQCHLWQFVFGTPSRSTYHNSEWANKMESIGLMPSSTGEPGGKRTGQCVADYALESGKFMKACIDLVSQGKSFKWLDRHAKLNSLTAPVAPHEDAAISLLNTSLASLTDDICSLQAPCDSKTKSKYQCPECKTNLWGKPDLRIRCDDCNTPFDVIN